MFRPFIKVPPVRFGSVNLIAVLGWDGSSGSGFVPTVPLWKVGFLLQYCFNKKGRFRFWFRFLKTVPTVPVPLPASGITVRQFRFAVPLRFLGHPVLSCGSEKIQKFPPNFP